MARVRTLVSGKAPPLARRSPAAHRDLSTAAHLAALVEHSNDAIFSRTLQGTITSWNAAAERIFGHRARDIIGRRSCVLLPRGLRDEFRSLLRRIQAGEVVTHFETERLHRSGRRLHVSLTLSPIRDPRGRLVGFSTIARDITEQRRVRAALERREHELADLFDGASIGLLTTTATGVILRANPALHTLLDCRPEACLGRRLHRFHADPTACADLLRRLARRESLRNVQLTLRTASGRPKEVLVDASALWDHGRVSLIRWFIRDISRRKQLEREVLAISERERRTFARELHDSLGQQLTGICYLNNVVRDRLQGQGSPEAAEVARISRLLKQAIAETRRLSRGLSPVRPEPGGLQAALRELAAHTCQVFGADCRVLGSRTAAALDQEAATHLYRIAQEAVTNALRHGRARRISISFTQDGGQVALRILDNGRGIPPLPPHRHGLGLRVMQYRAGLLQGHLTVQRRTRRGTEVRCTTALAHVESQNSDPP